MNRFFLTLLSIVAIGFGIMIEIPLDTLIVQTPNIVHGYVTSSYSFWDFDSVSNSSIIKTNWSIFVTDWLATSETNPPDIITITTLGGIIESDSIGLFVEDQPDLAIDQEVILFVEEPTANQCCVYRDRQGQFTVVNGEVLEKGMNLNDFISMIQARR